MSFLKGETKIWLRYSKENFDAAEVFKSAESAKKWLKEDAYGLGDIPPP